ncbi:MAG: hypothetical protein KatS3mg096_455 [Candidatus Parcubacteria bacterium]|nr:MAG: hypothetical protein KatS3mg096_455 [Candidatus Parcubacteria bacterium]
MKKFLLPLIFILTVGLIFSFVLVKAQENEENKGEKPVEIKYKPEKGEFRIPKLSENQLGQFKKLDDFVREKIAEHPGANLFFLNPSGHAAQQGVVDQNQNNVLTVNSQGFKMDWIIATDTMVISSLRLGLLAQATPQPAAITDIATGTRVRVLGVWDGQKLVAKRVVALERRVTIEVEKLIEKLREALQKAGINIDLTPLLQQLRK